MRFLYVGNILPLKVVNLLGLSPAGKLYEVALTKALDAQLNGNLDIISVSQIGRKEVQKLKSQNEPHLNSFQQIRSLNIPVLGDLALNSHFFILLIGWCLKNIKKRKVIIILNSPSGISITAILLKLIFHAKLVSLTIDTPFTGESNFRGIVGMYNKYSFLFGHHLLKWFSGIVVLNENVIKTLNLHIPYHITRIGFTEENYDFEKIINNGHGRLLKKKTILYAGTLTQSKGVMTLLRAFDFLDKEEFRLEMYGYGPLEKEIDKFAKSRSNITFLGRVEYGLLLEKLSAADLLVNPTETSNSADNFSFPSKIIEYMLSGKPVLTTLSKSMPQALNEYLFFVKEESPLGFANSIKNVFEIQPSVVRDKVISGITYIREIHNWTLISSRILDFINTL